MPKIIIQNLHNKEIFASEEDKNLLATLHHNQLDWMSACGGKGRCTTCKAIVIEGFSNFSAETAQEKKIRDSNKLTIHERLCCQTSISGDVVIKVAPENKFKYLDYSD